MKKSWLLLISVVLLSFMFCGCNHTGNNDVNELLNDSELGERESSKENTTKERVDKVDSNMTDLYFERVIANEEEVVDGITSGISHIEMGIMGEVLFWVDVFDDNKLKAFNMETKFLNIISQETQEYGKIYAGDKISYYSNGVSLYELKRDGKTKLVIEELVDKKLLDVTDNKICYCKQGKNKIYVSDINAPEESKVINFDIDNEEVKIIADSLFIITENEVVKIDIETGSSTTVCQYDMVPTIFWNHNNIVYIVDGGKIITYNMKSEQIESSELSEAEVVVFSDMPGGCCYIELGDGVMNKIVEATDEKKEYYIVLKYKKDKEYSIIDMTSSEKYIAVFSPAKNTGLYFAKRQ